MKRAIALAAVLLLAAGTAEASRGRAGVAAALRARFKRTKAPRPPRPARATGPTGDMSAAPAGARDILDARNPETPRPYAELRGALEKALSPGEWQGFAAMSWKPYSLRGRWVGEHRPGFVSKGTARRQVSYLGRGERAKYRVTIGKDGLLYDARGKRFSAGPNSLLVMDTSGNLYARDANDIAADPSSLTFAHSSFLAGGPVAMSVEVEVKDGKAIHAKNRSGHYRPSRANFVSWIIGMEGRGLDVSALRVSFDAKSTVEDDDPATFER